MRRRGGGRQGLRAKASPPHVRRRGGDQQGSTSSRGDARRVPTGPVLPALLQVAAEVEVAAEGGHASSTNTASSGNVDEFQDEFPGEFKRPLPDHRGRGQDEGDDGTSTTSEGDGPVGHKQDDKVQKATERRDEGAEGTTTTTTTTSSEEDSSTGEVQGDKVKKSNVCF